MQCRSDQEQGPQNREVRRWGAAEQGGRVREGLDCDWEPCAVAVLIGFAGHRCSSRQRGSAVSGDDLSQKCFVTNSSGLYARRPLSKFFHAG